MWTIIGKVERLDVRWFNVSEIQIRNSQHESSLVPYLSIFLTKLLSIAYK